MLLEDVTALNNLALLQKEKLHKLFKKSELVAVYLFGSRAEGTEYESSDFDFGLLLKPCTNMEDVAMIQLEFEEEASSILGKEVDAIILNTATIEQKFSIISKGKLLYCSDDDKRTDFEDIAIRDYLDFKPFYEQYRKEAIEAIKEGDFFAKP